MHIRSSLIHTVIGIVCLIGGSLFAGDAIAQSNAAAKKQTTVSASSKGNKPVAISQNAKRNPDDPAQLKAGLDTFAKDCITRMNRQRRPGINSKEVKRQPDGTFLARYMIVDPDSLQTSYDPIDGNKTIKYIGRMQYHEVEYVCSGKDQKQAMAGPFSESNRVPVTELVKYKQGKWSY